MSGREKRSGLPRAIGYLLVIGGAALLLGGLVGGVLLLIASAALDGMAGMTALVEPSSAGGRGGPFADLAIVSTTKGALMLTMAAISLLGLIAGVGVVRARPFGERVARVWAGLALLYLAGDVVADVVRVRPALERALGELAAQMESAGGAADDLGVPVGALETLGGLGTVGTVANAVFLAVLPALCLVLSIRGRRAVHPNSIS